MLVLSPPPIDFGYVIPGSSAVECATITNQANLSATIGGVDFSGQAVAFAVSQSDASNPPQPTPHPVTIPAGASAKVCFSFTPPSAQEYIAGATLKTDDPSGKNPLVVMTGWGGGPQISCVPTSIQFVETLINDAATRFVTCTNSGSLSVAWTRPSIP